MMSDFYRLIAKKYEKNQKYKKLNAKIKNKLTLFLFLIFYNLILYLFFIFLCKTIRDYLVHS